MAPKWLGALLIGASTSTALALFHFYKAKKKICAEENDSRAHDSESSSHNLVADSDHSSDNQHASSDISVSLPPHIKREILKERKRKEKIKYITMKSPMYDNCIMLDPQGKDLSKISYKKARWYVVKDLAEWTDSNKRCIKLLFEPKDRCSDISLYLRSDKNNICVVCAGAENHMRHYVVPYAYRRLLPARFKTHHSHDVVLVCAECQLVCDQESHRRMKQLEESYRRYEPEPQYTLDPRLHGIRSKALALLNWKHKIPPDTITVYEQMVREHLQVTDSSVQLTPLQLQSAIDVDHRIENPRFVPGPKLIVGRLGGDEEKIASFVKSWRKHFVETIQPRHLPEGWSIDSPVSNGTK